jgi:hypothetical protein
VVEVLEGCECAAAGLSSVRQFVEPVEEGAFVWYSGADSGWAFEEVV